MGETSDSRGWRNNLPTADEITQMAARGDDFTSYYVRRCITIKPIRRIHAHFSENLLRSLDEQAAQLNVSREAALNILLRQALIQQKPKQPQTEQQTKTRKTA